MSARIYGVKNKINGKYYIGFTIKTVQQRIASHVYIAKCGSPFHFHRGIRKYGIESFEVVTLEENNDEQYTLNVLEPKWIRHFDSFKTGYNMTLGGGGMLGKKHTKETKRKMSIVQKLNPFPQKTREAGQKAILGRHLSEDHKRKISLSNVGKHRGPCSEETKKKISIALTNANISPEAKRKQSRIGMKHSKESRNKIAKSLLGRKRKPVSIETRDRISKSQMGHKYLNKMWTIQTPNDIVKTNELKHFCQINNLSYSTLKRTEYNQKCTKTGFKILAREDKPRNNK